MFFTSAIDYKKIDDSNQALHYILKIRMLLSKSIRALYVVLTAMSMGLSKANRAS